MISKNKHLTKTAEREPRRKCLTHFLRKICMLWKHWLYVNVRNTGKTLVTRTQGTKITSDDFTGYVFEVSLADLQNDETEFRKFKLITEDVEGQNRLTNFRGMGLTHDQTYFIVKKNGGSWLKVMWASRLPMVISFIYSTVTKCNSQIQKTSMASINKSAKSGRRQWKPWRKRWRQMTWKKWSINWFQKDI